MHKNYRRKIKQDDPKNFWRDHIRGSKNEFLKERTRSRRRRDNRLIQNGFQDEDAWDDIPWFEDPMDWYVID